MASAPNNTESTLASFIWNNANDLWGDFPHTEFGKIILPVRINRVVYSLFDKSTFEVSHKELSYSTTYGV